MGIRTEEHKRVLREQTRLEGVRGEDVSYNEAFDEVVANAMSKMLADGKVMERLNELKAQDADIARKLWAGLKKLLNKFFRVAQKQSALFHDTADLMELKAEFKQMQKMWAEAFVEASENYQASLTVSENQKFGERYSPHDTDRQQYNAFREKFAKERLDLLSDKLGKLFPLSAGFEQAIQNDKTKVSNMTVVANSLQRGNGESFYTAAKNAFKKVYGAKTTFSIKQLGINAEADNSFARESISKVSDRKDMQTILDLTPAFRQLIEESRLLAVERLIHNDTKEKKESLLCYRLYNAYIREETYIDANGSKQTRKVPHIVVFSVIQNLADAKAHMVTDIKDVAISNGPNSSKLHAAHANGNISINNIADVYDVVKSVKRKKGGLRYSPGEMAYKFDYTQKESGEQYSSQETDLDSKSHPYSYDTLISKPDMAVTTVDSNVPKSRADVVYQAKQNAAKVGKFDPKTGSVSVYVDDVGAEVVLGRDRLKHSLDRRLSVNAPVVLKAGEILQKSIRINETTPQKAEAAQSYVLIGTAMSENGELYIVRSVINRFSNELASIDVLYAINAKKESAALLPLFTDKSALGTDSTISIADLLDLVNRYFPDILPEDVLKHYGHDARPEGDLGKDALYSGHETDDISNRDLLANAFESITKSSPEYELIQEYKSRIKLLNEQEEKLDKLNAEIRRIRFTAGEYDAQKLGELEAEAKNVAKNINRHDKKLLRLEGILQSIHFSSIPSKF